MILHLKGTGDQFHTEMNCPTLTVNSSRDVSGLPDSFRKSALRYIGIPCVWHRIRDHDARSGRTWLCPILMDGRFIHFSNNYLPSISSVPGAVLCTRDSTVTQTDAKWLLRKIPETRVLNNPGGDRQGRPSVTNGTRGWWLRVPLCWE